MESFADNVAFIGGASTGIGAEVARQLAAKGVRVFLVARRDEQGRGLAGEIEKAGGLAHFHRADLSVAAECEAAVAACVAHYGALDLAFNNAGIGGPIDTPFVELTEEDWQSVMAVNFDGLRHCLREQLRHMRAAARGGSIVNMSSLAGIKAFANSAAYVVSKHAVVALTKVAALENGDAGIRVNALCPGLVDTEMTQRSFFADAGRIETLRASYPLGRFGSMDEVAKAALFLFSDAARFMTGQTLVVDGGASIA